MSVHCSQQQRWNGTQLPQMGAHAMVTCCSAGDGRVSLLVEMEGYSSSNSPPFAVTRQCLTIAQVRPLASASGQVPSQTLSAVTTSSVSCTLGTCCAQCAPGVQWADPLQRVPAPAQLWLLDRTSGACAVCACGVCSEALVVHTTSLQRSLKA